LPSNVMFLDDIIPTPIGLNPQIVLF